MIIRYVLLTLLISNALLVGLAVSGLMFGSYKATYDESSPDYHRYSAVFIHFEKELSQRNMSSKDSIDFSHLNGGEWKVVCVFGGYTNPLQEMQRLGALIRDVDRDRLMEAGSSRFRLSQVEEFESMVAYIDSRDQANFLHFEHGIGVDGQHYKKCIRKPDTTLILVAPDP